MVAFPRIAVQPPRLDLPMSSKNVPPGFALLGGFIRGQPKMMEFSQRELATLTKVSNR